MSLAKEVQTAQPLSPKIAVVTKTLEPSYRKMLQDIPLDNASAICNFILAENDIKDSTKEWQIKVLVYLSRFTSHKPFRELAKEDILAYLASLRKSEDEDPLHRWIGTQNNRLLVYSKFFKWLFNSDEPDLKKRIAPPCIRGIRHLKRKEKSAYKPSDMWTPIEHATFLKYCPSKRDRCYAAMNRDTSARPHELLRLKIGDVQMKQVTATGRQYAEIHVDGKTGARTLPLIDSLPFVKDWLQAHTQSGNPEAPLFVSQSDKNGGTQLTIDGIWWHFKYFKTKYFPRLLKKPEVSAEDKKIIKGMLQKAWNPYVFRHSALTEKAQILTEANLRNYAGWSSISKMPAVYLHFLGNESCKSLLEARGIIAKDDGEYVIQNKLCPHCNEPNKPDSKFCSACKMVMSYDAYSETVSEAEKTKNDVAELKENYQKLMSKMNELADNEEKLSEARDRVMVLKSMDAARTKSPEVQRELFEQVQSMLGQERTRKIIEDLRATGESVARGESRNGEN